MTFGWLNRLTGAALKAAGHAGEDAAPGALALSAREAARAPDDLGFRSTLFTALADEPMNQGVPNAWRNRFKKYGVTADEMRVSGIDEIFAQAGENTPVTREQLLEAGRRVELREVVRRELNTEQLARLEDLAEQERRARRRIQWPWSDPDYSYLEPMSEAASIRDPSARYRAYTVPGGTGYREFALRVENPMIGADYSSGHFGGKGVVAHFRTTDRTINGQRTLYLEEVQSDLFQQARDRGGFKGEVKPGDNVDLADRITSIRNDLTARYAPEDVAGAAEAWDSGLRPGDDVTPRDAEIMQDPMFRDLMRMVDQDRAAFEAGTDVSTRPPRAPFEQSWPEMVLRRAMRIASEEGYDAIAIASPRAAQVAQGHREIKKGIEEFYGARLPRALAKIGKDFGLATETATMRGGQPDLPVTLMSLTPEARETVKTRGFPMFGMFAVGGVGTLAALAQGSTEEADALPLGRFAAQVAKMIPDEVTLRSLMSTEARGGTTRTVGAVRTHSLTVGDNDIQVFITQDRDGVAEVNWDWKQNRNEATFNRPENLSRVEQARAFAHAIGVARIDAIDNGLHTIEFSGLTDGHARAYDALLAEIDMPAGYVAKTRSDGTYFIVNEQSPYWNTPGLRTIEQNPREGREQRVASIMAALAGGGALAVGVAQDDAQAQQGMTEDEARELAAAEWLAAVYKPDEAAPEAQAEAEAPTPSEGGGSILPTRNPLLLGGYVQQQEAETAMAMGQAAGSIAKGVPPGVVAGVNETADFLMDFAQILGAGLREAGYAESGFLDPSLPAPDQMAPMSDADVPNIPEPYSVEGDPLAETGRALAKFGVGFAASMSLPGLATAKVGAKIGGVIARNASRSFWAGSSVMYEQEDRLANMLGEVNPELRDSILGYLMTDEDETRWGARIKAGIENAGLDAVAIPLFLGTFRLIKGLRASRGAGPAPVASLQETVTPSPPENFVRALGDPEGELVSFGQLEADALGSARTGTVPGGDEVFINFARIDTDQDIQAVMGQMADALVTPERRGFAEMQLGAEKLSAWETLQARRPGLPLSAEQALAARTLWASSADKLRQLAVAASRSGSDADLFAFRRMAAVHHAIQSQVLEARAETARALASWRIPRGSSPEVIAQIDEAFASSGGSDAARLFAKRLADAPDSQLDAIVRGGALAKTRDALEEAWVNGLLWNPLTHAVNIMSNTATMFFDVAERFAGGLVGAASRGMGAREGVELGEAGAKLFGIQQAQREAWSHAWRALRTNETGFSTQTKAEIRRTGAISEGLRSLGAQEALAEGLGAAFTTPGRLLGAQDELFKTMHYRAEIHAQAFAEAMKAVRAGEITRRMAAERAAQIVDEATVQQLPRWGGMRQTARDEAARLTFTSAPTREHSFTRWLQGAQRFPIIGRIILPFVNTPANLMRYSFERTPLRLLHVDFYSAIRRGGRDRDMALAKLGVSSALLTSLVALASEGLITGAGPSDPGRRDALTRTGWLPYAVKINGRYYQYRRLDPFATLIGAAADFNEITANTEYTTENAEGIGEASTAMMLAVANNVLSKTYMTGLSDFFEMISNPERPDRAERWVSQTTGAFLAPNLLPPLRRAVDPEMRYSWDLISELRNRIPGLSAELPQQRDFWGREKTYQSGIGQAYDAFVPFMSRADNPEPIDREIVSQGFDIRMPAKELSFMGASVPLRNRYDVYARFLELRGQVVTDGQGRTMVEALNQIMTGQDPLSYTYAQLTDGPGGSKEALIKQAIQGYHEAAMGMLRAELLEANDPIVGRAQYRAMRRRLPASEMPEEPVE